MLYKGDKGVNDAACLPEGGPAEGNPAEGDPAEAGGFSASSLPLLDNAHTRIKANSKLMPSASSLGKDSI